MWEKIKEATLFYNGWDTEFTNYHAGPNLQREKNDLLAQSNSKKYFTTSTEKKEKSAFF